jgi:hypothetical protein
MTRKRMRGAKNGIRCIGTKERGTFQPGENQLISVAKFRQAGQMLLRFGGGNFRGRESE